MLMQRMGCEGCVSSTSSECIVRLDSVVTYMLCHDTTLSTHRLPLTWYDSEDFLLTLISPNRGFVTIGRSIAVV